MVHHREYNKSQDFFSFPECQHTLNSSMPNYIYSYNGNSPSNNLTNLSWIWLERFTGSSWFHVIISEVTCYYVYMYSSTTHIFDNNRLSPLLSQLHFCGVINFFQSYPVHQNSHTLIKTAQSSSGKPKFHFYTMWAILLILFILERGRKFPNC